jgi:hypothetical protein
MKKSVEIFSLHWNNVDTRMITAHKAVMQHFEIPLVYHAINMDHGQWMDQVMSISDAEVIVFLEPDCIPINKVNFLDAIYYAIENDTFCGIAQASNHIEPKNHIYAAPGFFAITQSAYNRLNKPSFMCTNRGDAGEEVSWQAEELNENYRVILPTHYERSPREGGVWNLGPLGHYGIGTVFSDTVYHLYQGRYNDNVELFKQRCNEVIAGTFSTAGFKKCMTLTGD